MNKLIINFTPTGMIPIKEMTPHVPVKPKEIIKDILASRQYGVSMAHIHARGKDGKPAYKREIYEEIIQGIRSVDKDLILCVSTSGRSWSEFEKRSECLDITGSNKPDMGSLTLSSLNFNKQASINSPQMIQMLAKKMLDNGIKPELEVFDAGMINYAKYLHSKKLIEPPFYFNLILGNIACAQANILNLGLLIHELPAHSIWAVGGVGDAQLKMNINGMINGGGVRVGIEDNIYLTSKRDTLATNMDLLKRIFDIAAALHIEIATPEEVRKALRLRKT
ncbi:3-keto-5-aminohexanoate cleavage protein [Candidatus Omnitrophota bacterium]